MKKHVRVSSLYNKILDDSNFLSLKHEAEAPNEHNMINTTIDGVQQIMDDYLHTGTATK